MSKIIHKILLIEDDQLNRELYAEILQDEGYQVEIATDGEEGYLKMKKGGFDLVLMDIMLPKIDGVNILRKLKEEKKLKGNKKIVLLTNLSEEALLSKGAEVKSYDYLVKSSVDPGQLISQVKDFLK
ncbi:response regulator transcription factor [Patescibacteria group bacterium]